MKFESFKTDADNFANLVFANESEWEVIYRFDGRPLEHDWEPLRLELLNGDLPVGDFLTFQSHIPVFGTRARDELGDIFASSGEILPLSCPAEDFFALNVTSLVDALDEENSDIAYLSNGKIFDIRRASFDPRLVSSMDLFKIPQAPLSKVFVSERFIERVKKAKLTGLLFE